MSDSHSTSGGTGDTANDAPPAAGQRSGYAGMGAYVRALMLLQHRRYREAAGLLRQALASNPDDAAAHDLLSGAYRALGDSEAALAEAREAVRLEPNDAGYMTTLALALREAGQRREADQVARSALAINPHDPTIHAVLGWMLLNRSKREKALAHAEAGLAIDPEHEDCAQLRASALSELGRTGEAADMARERLRRRPDDPEAHYDAGYAALHAGDAQRAAVHFREALRRNPTDEAARVGLAHAITGQRPVLGLFLRGLLWLSRQQTWALWAAVIALLIGPRLLRWWGGGSMATEITAAVLISAFQVLWITWMAALPLFNISLWLDRENRHVLSPGQLKAVRWHILLLGAALLAIPLVPFFRLAAFVTVLVLVLAPTAVETYYELEEEARPGLMRWYMALIAVLGAAAAVPLWVLIIGAQAMGPEAFADLPLLLALPLVLLSLINLPLLIAYAVAVVLDDWVATKAKKRAQRRFSGRREP